MGKWGKDFDLWLERARPWIPCASRLISLRVEQIIKDYTPGSRSEAALGKFENLLKEAFRQLHQPGSIQVLDLEQDEAPGSVVELEPPKATDRSGHLVENGNQVLFSWEGAAFPAGLVPIPEILHPEGDMGPHFRYVFPN